MARRSVSLRLSRVGLTILCLLLGSVVGSRVQGQESANPSEALVVIEPSLPQSFHPFDLYATQPGVHLAALLYETMVRLDPSTNLLVPNLMGELERKSDRVYTARLLPDLKWHDGKPVTVRDATRTVERLKDSLGSDSSLSARTIGNTLLGIVAAEGGEREGGLVSVEEGEPGQFVFNFRRSTDIGEALHVLSMFILLPAHITDNELKRKPVGLGPYMMEAEYTEGPIILERNETYFRGVPRILRMELRAVPAMADRVKAVADGVASIAVDVLEPLASSLNERVDLRVQPNMSRTMYYLGFNMEPGFQGARFGDRPWLREVVARTLDREDLLRAFGETPESGVLLTGPFRPESQNTSREVAAISPNPQRVQELFQVEGFERVAQFYQDSSGTPLEAVLAYDSSQPDMERVAQRMREQLERGGIGIRLAPRSGRDFAILLTGDDRRFDLVLHKWNLDEDEDLYEVFHSRGTYNYLRYHNDDVDKDIEQARRASNYAVRLHYRWQLHEKLAEDLPAIFLWSPRQVAIFDAKVGGVPILDPYYFFRDVHRWEIQQLLIPMGR